VVGEEVAGLAGGATMSASVMVRPKVLRVKPIS
jgi:hypothetical protein